MNSTPEDIVISRSSYPPMLQQYLEYKDRYPDCLLFFQVGDFYELFFEDAKICAKAINLTLTSRDKSSNTPIPMCGVPIAVADQYCDRLVDLDFSVAIVSQVSNPTGKGIVQRKLERIITPAIKLLAGANSANSKGSVGAFFIRSQKDCAIAVTNVQDKQILVKDGLTIFDLTNIIKELEIRELILPLTYEGKSVDRRINWVKELETNLPSSSIKFRVTPNQSHSQVCSISGFKELSPSAKVAVSMLAEFIDEVTVEVKFSFTSICPVTHKEKVFIDPTTRDNLELVKNLRDGSERGTLFDHLNFTKTIGGSRYLRQQIISPCFNVEEIKTRQNFIEKIIKGHKNSNQEFQKVLSVLDKFLDLERIASRIELEVVSPKELGALRDVLLELKLMHSALLELQLDTLLTQDKVNQGYEIGLKLNEQLVEEPPYVLSEGGIFRGSFNSELEQLIEIQNNTQFWLSEFEAKERQITNIPSLKVKYTSVFGYFIEVSNTHLKKVPDNYHRKQTTTNSERFITPELKSKEEQILKANDKRINLEKELFIELKLLLKEYCELFRALCKEVSYIDFLFSLAQVAINYRFTKPEITNSKEILIEQGRHPQLAKLLENDFIPNDSYLLESGSFIHILTGPNMGGKSTYLRQVALITILAHIGSYVPAEKAVIGLVDKIFARLGASDNIAEGESTFMVEMREAGFFINQATEKSLLIIDEIGRGTSTKDGLSIAQSILEWIVTDLKARTIFATHFHEITELEKMFPTIVKNISVGSIIEEGRLIFTHKIIAGPATRSFGIEVARRAGIPANILKRAQKLLRESSLNNYVKNDSNCSRQLSLFSETETFPQVKDLPNDNNFFELKKIIDEIDPDLLTPKEALFKIYHIKQILKEVSSK